jgi:hypothetical protein
MTECEGTNNCATWRFLGRQGIGQWPSGEIANLSVELFDDTSVTIRRADPTGESAGLIVLYKGTRHGNLIGGEFKSTWPKHWEEKPGNWYATIEGNPPDQPSIMRLCISPDYTGCWTFTRNGGHYDAVFTNNMVGTMTLVSFSPESVIIRIVVGEGSATAKGTISSDGNSILLLIRLFQQAPIGSIGECLSLIFQRRCGSFNRSLPPKRHADSIWPRVAGRMGSCVQNVGIGTLMNWRASGDGSVQAVGIRCL